jgi:endo-1,4-beta-D-glucanase Y
MKRAWVLLALLLAGCEWLHPEHQEAARSIVEQCLREAWVQGEVAGKWGPACAALNQWVRQQGWAAQPQ